MRSTYWRNRLARFGESTPVTSRIRTDREWEATPMQRVFLQFITDHPGIYTQREIARRLGVSPGMVQRNIAAWQERGVLNVSVIGSGIHRKTKLWTQPGVVIQRLASTIVSNVVRSLQRSKKGVVSMVRADRDWPSFWAAMEGVTDGGSVLGTGVVGRGAG